MKPLFLALFALALVQSLQAQPQKPDYTFVRTSDKRDHTNNPLENQRVLDRTPIFDNAPFLKLKPGDELLEAQERFLSFKGGTSSLLRKQLYLRSGETIQEISADWDGQKATLREASMCPFFAWDLSLGNAQALYKPRISASDRTITSAQWKLLSARLRQDWSFTLRDTSFASPKEPHLEDGRAIFEALVYNNVFNRLVFRRTTISPTEYSVKDWFLVVGPRQVDESETRERNVGVINGPGPYLPSELERNRRDYAIQQRFRSRVGEVIPSVSP